jgi:hypothetical protein
MLSIKDYNRKKDSAILLIFSIACIALATISYPNYTNAVIIILAIARIITALSLVQQLPLLITYLQISWQRILKIILKKQALS